MRSRYIPPCIPGDLCKEVYQRRICGAILARSLSPGLARILCAGQNACRARVALCYAAVTFISAHSRNDCVSVWVGTQKMRGQEPCRRKICAPRISCVNLSPRAQKLRGRCRNSVSRNSHTNRGWGPPYSLPAACRLLPVSICAHAEGGGHGSERRRLYKKGCQCVVSFLP